jgi:hypothetical protein
LKVTDDVSIVKYLNASVKITQGSYTNLKVGGQNAHDRYAFQLSRWASWIRQMIASKTLISPQPLRKQNLDPLLVSLLLGVINEMLRKTIDMYEHIPVNRFYSILILFLFLRLDKCKRPKADKQLACLWGYHARCILCCALQVITPEDLLLAEKLILEAEEQQAAQELGSGVQAVHVSNLTLQQDDLRTCTWLTLHAGLGATHPESYIIGYPIY